MIRPPWANAWILLAAILASLSSATLAGATDPIHHRLIMGGDHDYPPHEFLDQNGKPAGFNVDLAQAVAG